MDAARAGTPTVVPIEGEPGLGKTTLLGETANRLEDFQVLRGFGEEYAQDERFQLLQQWRVLADGDATPPHAVAASRLLARYLEPVQRRGPVALLIDDLQWIDPESVDTVAALLHRAAGDRLLVVAAHRPLGRRHPAWRTLADAPSTATVRLAGLDHDGAAELVTELAPNAPKGLAEQLRVHTEGNPLYLRALLREHSPRELTALAARGELPAPADLVATVAARLTKLSPDAARMLYGLAVLGDAWTDIPTAAAVSDVSDGSTVVGVLREQGLVRLDRTATLPRVRISHALIRAAVYEVVPGSLRSRLHRAAAARVTDAGARLRHRFAATAEADESLASDLERYADALHTDRRYREAVEFRRRATGASADAGERERRRLDADFEAALAEDYDEVSFGDPQSPAELLVEAMRLTTDKQWLRAARLLDRLYPDHLADLDPVNRYRARVLRGWTTIAAGRPTRDAVEPLRAAAASPVRDDALHGLFTFAYGQAMQAVTDRRDELWGFHEIMATDRAALAGSPEGLVQLAYRGSSYALTGSPSKAIGDLSVVTARIDDGTMALGDGAFHALLGFAYWFAGQWQRASINIDLARAIPRGEAHPVVLATAPLAAVVAGDGLAESLARSREARLAGPLPSALQAGDIAEVAALAYAGTPAQRRQWRDQRIADFGDPSTQSRGVVPYLWLLAMGLGAAWAGDAEATDAWADALGELRRGPWRRGAITWLRALARGARDPSGAGLAASLTDAAREGLADLASGGVGGVDPDQRLEAREGGPTAAATRARASAALNALDGGRSGAALLPPGDTTTDPLARLSEREREVVALLLEGLSYTQIAEELFVTRSTVAHHLSNTYAKTGTTTRHELTRLVRGR